RGRQPLAHHSAGGFFPPVAKKLTQSPWFLNTPSSCQPPFLQLSLSSSIDGPANASCRSNPPSVLMPPAGNLGDVAPHPTPPRVFTTAACTTMRICWSANVNTSPLLAEPLANHPPTLNTSSTINGVPVRSTFAVPSSPNRSSQDP